MEQNEGKTVAEWIDGIDEKEIKPLKVYQLKEIETRPEQLKKIAKSFGFDGEVHSADGISAIAHEDQVLVSYEDTGAPCSVRRQPQTQRTEEGGDRSADETISPPRPAGCQIGV